MTEIKNTLAILKARWPEVILIAGLHILSMLSAKFFRVVKPDWTITWALLYIGFSLFIMIISIILYLGFLRTCFLDAQKPRTSMVLLKTGKHFFGRMIGFGILFAIVYFILAWLIFLIAKQFTSVDASFSKTAKVAPLLYQLCFIGATLILIKPFLFIPALIIVLDCRVFESFKFFKQFKLSDAKELVALFCVQAASTLLWVFLPKLAEAETILQYTLGITPSIIPYFIGLIVSVIAVRFVASQNLVYDDRSRSLDSQDLLKPLI